MVLCCAPPHVGFCMCQPSGQISTDRTITRPFSKLNRLCAESAARGGTLTTFAAVANALALSRARVTQMFGHGQEHRGTVVKADTLGRLVAAFIVDGVPCQVEWLYSSFEEFASYLAAT